MGAGVGSRLFHDLNQQHIYSWFINYLIRVIRLSLSISLLDVISYSCSVLFSFCYAFLSSISILLMSLFLLSICTSASHLSLTPRPLRRRGVHLCEGRTTERSPSCEGERLGCVKVRYPEAYETSSAPRCSFTARIVGNYHSVKVPCPFGHYDGKSGKVEVRHHVLLCQRRILRF